MRQVSPWPTRNGGHLHHTVAPAPCRQLPPRPRRAPTVDFEQLMRRDVGRAADRAAEVDAFADTLGVHPEALAATKIGWTGSVWSWPMHDHQQNVVGTRLRDPVTGRKYAVRGSREGIFMPGSLGDASDPLLVVEGPTDLAAAITLGEYAIGRPNCRGGRLACQLLARGRFTVIVADADAVGRSGAAELAARLVLICPDVRVIEPPIGIKDLRDWVKCGATREDLWVRVAAALPMKISFEGGNRG